MTIARNILHTLRRVVGNREPIAAQLLDANGDAVDLTGRTLYFRMVELSGGTVVVNNVAATVTDAATGLVQYSPAAEDVDTAGVYGCYFIDDNSPSRRWPADGARLQLELLAETDAG